MSKPGYFLVARGFLDHPKFRPTGPFSRAEVGLWMFEAAAWEPRAVAITTHSRRQTVELQRGQFTYSIRYLATAWRWSINRVQRYVRELEDDGTIETRTDTGQLIVTLCNYEEYQSPKRRTDTHTDTQSNTHSATHADTNKKETNESKKDIARSGKDDGSKLSRSKSRSSEAEGFADWYAVYPKKTARIDAEKAYRQTMARGDIAPADLLARTKAFADKWSKRPKVDLQYCPYPARWLRAGSFDDDSLKAATPTAPKQGPQDLSAQQWRSAMSVWRTYSQWSRESWGPPPGEPGCLVPAEILSPTGGPPNGATH